MGQFFSEGNSVPVSWWKIHLVLHCGRYMRPNTERIQQQSIIQFENKVAILQVRRRGLFNCYILNLIHCCIWAAREKYIVLLGLITLPFSSIPLPLPLLRVASGKTFSQHRRFNALFLLENTHICYYMLLLVLFKRNTKWKLCSCNAIINAAEKTINFLWIGANCSSFAAAQKVMIYLDHRCFLFRQKSRLLKVYLSWKTASSTSCNFSFTLLWGSKTKSLEKN